MHGMCVWYIYVCVYMCMYICVLCVFMCVTKLLLISSLLTEVSGETALLQIALSFLFVLLTSAVREVHLCIYAVRNDRVQAVETLPFISSQAS